MGKQGISSGVTAPIIDQLETVKIDETDGMSAVFLLRFIERVLEPDHEDGPVGQARQRIMKCRARDPFLIRTDLGYIIEYDNGAQHAVRWCFDGGRRIANVISI